MTIVTSDIGASVAGVLSLNGEIVPATAANMQAAAAAGGLTAYLFTAPLTYTTGGSVIDFRQGQYVLLSVAAAAAIKTAGGSMTQVGTQAGGSPMTMATTALVAGTQQGTLIDFIDGVPSGVTPTFTPNDGRIVVLGDTTNGWALATGTAASSAGIIAGAINATGVTPLAVNIAVSAATTKPATGYYFASTRHRTCTNVGPVVAGTEEQIHVLEFYSPSYVTNTYRCAMPGHYTNSSGATPIPCGVPMPNAINIEAMSLWAYVGSTWIQAVCNYGGSGTYTVNPGPGLLTDDAVFASNIPAATRMQVRTALNVTAGGSMIGSVIASIQGAETTPFRTVACVDGATGGSTTQSAQVNATIKPTGTDCRVSGTVYGPSFIVAKPVSALDRPVFLHYGDSKSWGKNEDMTFLATKYLSAAFVARIFDDDASSRRMPAFICSIPSMGFPSMMPEATGGSAPWGLAGSPQNIWALMQMVPNCPYTHITDDHYNNGGLVTADPTYRTRFAQYWGKLLRQSTYWGNMSAPLYKFRVIPRCGSWGTTLAGQSPGSETISTAYTNYNRWALDGDLVALNVFPQLAGAVNTNDLFAYDQSANRDRTALITRTYSLAASYTSGSTTVVVNEVPQLDDLLVFNSAISAGSGYVRAISGTGPYTITMNAGVVVSGLNTGAVIPLSNVSDSAGLHPSAAGHQLVDQPGISWKQATFG